MKYAFNICEANISQRSYFTLHSNISHAVRRISLKKRQESVDFCLFFWCGWQDTVLLCKPCLLDGPRLGTELPSAQHSATKQFTGLFCLTPRASLRFKSCLVQKNKPHPLDRAYFSGADDRTWTCMKLLSYGPEPYASANSATSANKVLRYIYQLFEL